MNNKRLECFSDTPDSVTRLRAIFDDKMPTDPKWRLMWECGFDTAVLDMRRRIECAEALLRDIQADINRDGMQPDANSASTPCSPNGRTTMSEHMKNAYELAPFISEALRKLAGETAVPDTDDREWTQQQKHSHQFAVDIAEDLYRGAIDGPFADALKAHAEAARDAAMEERHG